MLSSISPHRELAPTGAQGASGDVFGERFAAMSEKMGAFFENANRVAAQMGAATQASYATTNSNVTYDNRSYDNKSSFNINDASGQPEVTAAMVDRNQSLRIRNMRGVFA
jgi:hypothetical protein